MIAKDPAARYQTATEVITALSAIDIPADAPQPVTAPAPVSTGAHEAPTVLSELDITESQRAVGVSPPVATEHG